MGVCLNMCLSVCTNVYEYVYEFILSHIYLCVKLDSYICVYVLLHDGSHDSQVFYVSCALSLDLDLICLRISTDVCWMCSRMCLSPRLSLSSFSLTSIMLQFISDLISPLSINCVSFLLGSNPQLLHSFLYLTLES